MIQGLIRENLNGLITFHLKIEMLLLFYMLLFLIIKFAVKSYINLRFTLFFSLVLLIIIVILGGASLSFLGLLIILAEIFIIGETFSLLLRIEMSRISKFSVGIVVLQTALYLIATANLFNRKGYVLVFTFSIFAFIATKYFSKQAIFLFSLSNVYSDFKSFILHKKTNAFYFALFIEYSILSLMYTFLPDVGYDSLAFKSWLAKRWVFQGNLDIPLATPWVGVTGSFTHLLSIPAFFNIYSVGALLQWISVLLLIGTVWSRVGMYKRNFSTTLMGFSLVNWLIMPQVFWQIGTGYDDLYITTIVFGLLIFALEVKIDHTRARAVIGILASSLFLAKLHTFTLATMIPLIYLSTVTRKYKIFERVEKFSKDFTQIAFFGLIGLSATWVYRFCQTGNPIFPVLNNFFKSPYYETNGSIALGQAYGPGGLLALIEMPFNAFVHPEFFGGMNIIGIVLLGPLFLFVSFIHLIYLKIHKRVGFLPLSIVISTFIFWWATSRYLPYLLPLLLVSPYMGFYYGNKTISSTQQIPKLKRNRTGIQILNKFNYLALILIPFLALESANLYREDAASKSPIYLFSESARQDYFTKRVDSLAAIKYLNKNAQLNANISGINFYERSYLRKDLLLVLDWELRSNFIPRSAIDYFVIRESDFDSFASNPAMNAISSELIQNFSCKFIGAFRIYIRKME